MLHSLRRAVVRTWLRTRCWLAHAIICSPISIKLLDVSPPRSKWDYGRRTLQRFHTSLLRAGLDAEPSYVMKAKYGLIDRTKPHSYVMAADGGIGNCIICGSDVAASEPHTSLHAWDSKGEKLPGVEIE